MKQNSLLGWVFSNIVCLKLYIVKIRQGNGSMMYCAISNVFWLLPENNDHTKKIPEVDQRMAISILTALNTCKILLKFYISQIIFKNFTQYKHDKNRLLRMQVPFRFKKNPLNFNFDMIKMTIIGKKNTSMNLVVLLVSTVT